MIVEEIYDELIEKIKRYHPASHLTVIDNAYRFALAAHGDQLRASGEPFIIHPLSVAVLLAELELDLESIAAGILHDVVEDTRYTLDDIVSHFNAEIAMLVDGVTKLEKVQYMSKLEEQAENYRKMFMAMANDIRVILIKIADRLHNMRTLKYRPPEKQRQVAQETMDIYAPLAHRLGISKMRYELEDLSFKYLDSEFYFDLANKISRKQSEREVYVNSIVSEIHQYLSDNKFKATVDGRPKHFFSIYKKMVAKDKSLDQIYDLYAVRVLVNEIRECYEVMGVLHEKYKPVPGRIKDYIAMPKSNRYQSLHTTLIGPDGEPFEVQIRTWEMHRISEYGIAAHWKYKENKGGQTNPDSEEAKLSWLRQMLELQRELADNQEYLDALKVDLSVFKNNVYCFTPKGEVLNLSCGATPIDFAYAIHSAVGNKMVGARVNGRIVTFDYILNTGDRVEIITSQNSKGPARGWLNIVKTTQARNKINQWFKNENRSENVTRGKELLEAEAKKKNILLADYLADGRDEIVLNRFNCPDMESLYAAVGHGSVREGKVISRLITEYEKDRPPAADAEIIQELINEHAAYDGNRNKKSGITVKDVGDVDVRFSKCCSPLPGDEIVAFVTRGRGVSIHRSDCPNIISLDGVDRKRLMEADWELPVRTSDSMAYHTELRINCDDRDGLVYDVSRILREEKVKVSKVDARTSTHVSYMMIGVEIHNRAQLDKLCDKILKLPGTFDIERVIS